MREALFVGDGGEKTALKDATGKRRKLKKQEVERLKNHLAVNLKPGNRQDKSCEATLQVPTRVDLPLGELLNPEMSEIIKDWAMAYTFTLGKITPQHQFNAQGLEGLVSVENVPLYQALLAASKTGIYRIEVFVPHEWADDPLQGDGGFLGDGSSTREDRL